jgi:hypothetical protein
LFQIIAAAAIIALAVAMWLLVKQLRHYFGEVKGGTVAVLDQARDAAASAAESARTVKGSVTFVSDTVVTPVIGVTAAVVGATQFVDSLIRGVRRDARRGGGT